MEKGRRRGVEQEGGGAGAGAPADDDAGDTRGNDQSRKAENGCGEEKDEER